MVHGLPHEPHENAGEIPTPLDTPLSRAAPQAVKTVEEAPPLKTVEQAPLAKGSPLPPALATTPPAKTVDAAPAMETAKTPPPVKLGAAAPPQRKSASVPDDGKGYPGGFRAETTIFSSEAPEKLDFGAIRVTSLEQALQVLGENKEKVLIARRLNLGDGGAAKLAAALRNNTCLEEVYLSQVTCRPRPHTRALDRDAVPGSGGGGGCCCGRAYAG